jgi:IS605 OrfB family transposase
VKRVERVRLYATSRQLQRLQFMLDVTRELYNALLEQRREAYKRRGIRVSTKQQYAELTSLRKCDARVRAVFRECEDAVLHRLDLAFAAFFRRITRGHTPGYPRFKPRMLAKARLQLERLQRVVARRRRGGGNRRKVARRLARLHESVANRRRDALHKAARNIVDAAPSTIVLEKLNVRGMTRSACGTLGQPGRNVAAKAGLNRALLDAAFGLLQQLIVSKAEEAGITVAVVDAHYSSQECWRCHHVAAESRVRRRFHCVACGYTVHADVNAALVMTRPVRSRLHYTT